MRYGKFVFCLLPLLVATACGDDDGVTNVGPPPPMAGVRFINAAVDTGAVDLRFWDRIENLPNMNGVVFRGTSGMYSGVGAGDRPTRVFPSGSNLNLVSTRLVDTQLPLAAGQRYTLVYAGRAAAGAPADETARLAVVEDLAAGALPAPGAGEIALQALHVAVGTGSVDVYIVPVDTTNAPTPADWATNNAGVLRNVGYLAKANAYVTVPVRPTSPRLPLYRFVVTRAGSTEELFAVTPNQPGAAPTASVGAQPGVQRGGSVMTVVVLPGATPGTRGAVASGASANLAPTITLIPDKQLNP